MLFRLGNAFVRFEPGFTVAVDLLIEIQRHDEQQLLESVVQRPCDLLARIVLGQRQIPRHLTQLCRSVFQLRRAFLKG